MERSMQTLNSALPKELNHRKSFVDSDNVRIGNNIRYWVAKRKQAGFSISYKEIASYCNIHPVSLSRILRGYGTSEATLIAISSHLGIAPGHLIVGVNHIARFPSIDSVCRGSQVTKQHIGFYRLDDLFQDKQNVSRFIGAMDEEGEEWAKLQLWRLREVLRKRREALIDRGYFQ